MRRADVAEVIEQSYFAFDGDHYRLHAWTIVPNLVHVLFGVSSATSFGEIVASCKRFTARQANHLLGRSGTFWQGDCWDRFIRNEEHFNTAVSYTDHNPVKAGLAKRFCRLEVG